MRSRRSFPERRASRIRSTCSAEPQPRRTPKHCCRCCSRPARRRRDHAVRAHGRPRSREDVARAIDDVAATEAAGKPVLAVVMSAEGSRRPSMRAKATSPRSRIPSPRPGRWAAPPRAPTGCAGRTERFPALEDDRQAAQPRASSTARSCAARTSWLEPAETRAAAAGIRHSARRTSGLQTIPPRPSSPPDELGYPVVVKIGRGRRPQDRAWGESRSTSPTTMPYAMPPSGSAHRCSSSRWCARCRAPRGRRPGSGVRSARGIRPRGRARRAHRRGRVPDRAPDRPGRRGTRPERQDGAARCGFRGAPAADAGAVIDLVHRLARLGDEVPAVVELDLNPVIARPNGCVAVDARVRVRHLTRVNRPKTW